MATTNYARFTINATPSEDDDGKRGYDATTGEELTITLETNPAPVLTVTYQLYDSEEPYGDTPLNSLYDTDQVFNETGTASVTTSSPNDEFTITINAATDISSYCLRATVVTANGSQVFERLIAVRKNGLRMTVPAEVSQYNVRGWSDAMNELTKAVADGSLSVVLVDSSNTGIVASFPSGVRRILHSDGSTSGGSWAQLTATDLAEAVASEAITTALLEPGTDGQVLRTVGTSVEWGDDVTLNPPTDPDDDGKVALASGGDLTYGLITNSQIDSSAAIDISKLSAGSEGQVIIVSEGVATWGEDTTLTPPVSPDDDGKVALASGGDLVYGYITNSQISSSAAIDITKLSVGSEGYVIKVVGGVVSWAVDGGATANLPSTPDDDSKVAFANAGNLDYADGVTMLNVDADENAIGLSGVRFASVTSSPATPTGSEGAMFNNAGQPKWTNTSSTYDLLMGSQPVATTDTNKVAIANSSGLYVAGLITNAQIDDSASIDVTKLSAGSESEVLSVSGGVVSWNQITDVNIDDSASIAVTKLSAGDEGQYLRTVSSTVVWTSELDGAQLISESVGTTSISPGTASRVLVTDASSVVTWTQLTNDFISSTAAVAVTKLATGSTNSVLASDGTSNFWDTTPTVSTLTGTSFLKTEGYIALDGASMPGDADTYGTNLFCYHWGVLAARFGDSTVWELSAQSYEVEA